MKKNRIRISVKWALSIIVFVVGLIILLYGVTTKDYKKIHYTEDNSINYKVFLKENHYFETPYLEENRTYIASLIDYIDIDYNYVIQFDEAVTGRYKYYIKASVYANKPNGDGYYWFKDYNLTEPQEMSISDTDSYVVHKNIHVNYDEYNQILNAFKKEYSMQTDGQLQIHLIVESAMKGEHYTDDIDLSADLKLSIPLLQQTVEASISKDVISHEKTLSMVDDSNQYIYICCIIVGVLMVSLALSSMVDLGVYLVQRNKNNLYKTKLKKILRNHDSIIANVTSLPSIEGLKTIKVTTFEELLDVYNEVRMPINYYQNHKKDESTFMIINDGVVWLYRLNKEDIEDDKKV